MVTQVDMVEVDINSGFNKVMNQEINERLLKLQKNGCIILSISQPLPDGRKVYVTITFDDPSIDIKDWEPKQ